MVEKTNSKFNSNHKSLVHNSQNLNLDVTHALFIKPGLFLLESEDNGRFTEFRL